MADVRRMHAERWSRRRSERHCTGRCCQWEGLRTSAVRSTIRRRRETESSAEETLHSARIEYTTAAWDVPTRAHDQATAGCRVVSTVRRSTTPPTQGLYHPNSSGAHSEHGAALSASTGDTTDQASFVIMFCRMPAVSSSMAPCLTASARLALPLSAASTDDSLPLEGAGQSPTRAR